MQPERKNFYQTFCFPLLEKLDPETTHQLTLSLLETIDHHRLPLRLLREIALSAGYRETPRLQTQLATLDLVNPFLLAAGMDKNAQCPHVWRALGFSSVVIGSVTRFPQPGNPKPRLFRASNSLTLLNHLGFPSDGSVAVATRLGRLKPRDFPLGLSLGVNKDSLNSHFLEDLYLLSQQLTDTVDYLELNLSSPNTEGLKNLQAPTHLKKIIQAIHLGLNTPTPIFLKLSPDLNQSEIESLVELVIAEKIDGVVATNTTTDSQLKSQLPNHLKSQPGGISGQLLRQKSNQVIREIFKLSLGQIPIIGCGGVHDLQSTLEKFSAGASAISLYTGLVYKGPTLVATLTRQLDDWMISQGVKNISEIRGQQI